MRLLQFRLSWFMRVKLIVGLKTENTQELFNNSEWLISFMLAIETKTNGVASERKKHSRLPQWVCPVNICVYSLMQNCSRLTAELRTGCSSCRALLGQRSMWERWKHDWRAWEWWPGSGGSSVRQSWRHFWYLPIVLSDLMSVKDLQTASCWTESSVFQDFRASPPCCTDTLFTASKSQVKWHQRYEHLDKSRGWCWWFRLLTQNLQPGEFNQSSACATLHLRLYRPRLAR